MKDSKTVTIQNKINDCKGDQKKIFKIIDSLLGRKKQQVLPEYTCSFSLATMINTFFVEKIDSIRAEFPLLEPTLQLLSVTLELHSPTILFVIISGNMNLSVSCHCWLSFLVNLKLFLSEKK